jgi:hypothetical protein
MTIGPATLTQQVVCGTGHSNLWNFSITTYPDGKDATTAEPTDQVHVFVIAFWAIDPCADLIQCTLSGFLSANDTNPTMNILTEAPWYSVSATNTTQPIALSCMTAPSACSTTLGAAKIKVVAMDYIKVTVPTPWEDNPSEIEAYKQSSGPTASEDNPNGILPYGVTFFGRGCDAEPSNITLETFTQTDDWKNTTSLKTITVSPALTPEHSSSLPVPTDWIPLE